MPSEILIPPTGTPVTLDDCKSAMGVSIGADDAFIEGLIGAAVEYIESATGRKLLAQTWVLYLDAFPCWAITFPFAKVSQVNAIRYYDSDNALQTLSTASYQADCRSLMGRVAPVSGGSWPATYDRFNAVEVEFVAGAASPAAVPHRAKQAVKALVSHWYENREATISGTIIAPLPFGLTMLIRNLWTGKYS